MSFVKKRKESGRFGAAQETAERERPKEKTEKTGFASCKTFKRQEIGAFGLGRQTIFQPTYHVGQ
jgi:hypothetical protein